MSEILRLLVCSIKLNFTYLSLNKTGTHFMRYRQDKVDKDKDKAASQVDLLYEYCIS